MSTKYKALPIDFPRRRTAYMTGVETVGRAGKSRVTDEAAKSTGNWKRSDKELKKEVLPKTWNLEPVKKRRRYSESSDEIRPSKRLNSSVDRKVPHEKDTKGRAISRHGGCKVQKSGRKSVNVGHSMPKLRTFQGRQLFEAIMRVLRKYESSESSSDFTGSEDDFTGSEDGSNSSSYDSCSSCSASSGQSSWLAEDSGSNSVCDSDSSSSSCGSSDRSSGSSSESGSYSSTSGGDSDFQKHWLMDHEEGDCSTSSCAGSSCSDWSNSSHSLSNRSHSLNSFFNNLSDSSSSSGDDSGSLSESGSDSSTSDGDSGSPKDRPVDLEEDDSSSSSSAGSSVSETSSEDSDRSRSDSRSCEGFFDSGSEFNSSDEDSSLDEDALYRKWLQGLNQVKRFKK